MVTLGCDSHKRTHTVVAVDGNGRQLGSRTVPTTSAGNLEALRWARQWPARRWALEDCRQVSRRLESDLLRAGELVLRVPPKLMAGVRRGGRELGKSDAIDALAIARAALRESDLPEAQLAGRERDARLLSDHREDLVGERTRTQNRLRWHLHELEPEFTVAPGALDRQRVLTAVKTRLERHQGTVARIAIELVDQIGDLSLSIRQLDREITALMHELSPTLLELEGCGAMTAAKIVGHTADVSRFHSRAAYAMTNGTAPIPVSSGNQQRFRLNRGGNRQLNAALYRIAVTQARMGGPGAAYLQRQLDAGATKPEARRAHMRRLSDEVYKRLWLDRNLLAIRPPDLAA